VAEFTDANLREMYPSTPVSPPKARPATPDPTHAALYPTMFTADEAIEAEIRGWAERSRADPEIGGDEALQVARSMVSEFGEPSLKRTLDQTGLGNHPEVIRLLTRAGKALQKARSGR
jgi:hypothetical protein